MGLNPSHFNRRIQIFWIWIPLKIQMSQREIFQQRLIIRFCKYRENHIKTEQLNKETNSHNLMDLKAS